MTDRERAELDARLERMTTKPNRAGTGDGFFLLWMARDDAGKSQVMMWRPETAAEIRAATLFHDAAHGLGAFARSVKKGKPVRRPAEHRALIAGVLAARDDETGYLAYADYLTENGDPHGDFIRLCVESDRLPPGSPEREAKNARMSELRDAHAEEWFAPLGALGLRPLLYGSFQPWLWLSPVRGVIEQVTIDRPGVLPENAARLFAAAPFLRKLAYERGHLDPAGLAKVRQLAQIEELELSYSDLTAAGLRTLLRSKHLTGLKVLNLSGNEIGDDGAAALAAWPGLGKLDSLDVSGCVITAAGLARLVTREKFASLKRARLGRRNALDGVSLTALLNPPHRSQLTELGLDGAAFELATPRFFRTAPFANTLSHLDLDAATFHPGAFEEFARSPLPALTVLKLNNVNLSAAAAALARAPFLATLEELYLDNCALGGPAPDFFRRGRLPRLTTLDVSRNRLGRAGVMALAAAVENLPALTGLRLWDNQLGAEAAGALAGSKLLTNLTTLDLSANKITPAGAVAVAGSKFLTKLTSLVVDEQAVGKKGKRALLDRFGEAVVTFR